MGIAFQTPFSKLPIFQGNIRVAFNRFIREEYSKIDWSNITRLKEVISKHYSGEYIPSSNYQSGETNCIYLSVGNFTGFSPEFNDVNYLSDDLIKSYESIKLQSGDLIFTRSASVGHVHLLELPEDGKIYIPSHHLLVVRLSDENFKNEILVSWLQSDFVKKFLVNFSQGKNQKELTNWSVKNLPLPDIKHLSDKLPEINRKLRETRKYIEEATVKKVKSVNIINKAFAEVFNWDMPKFENLRAIHTFKSSLSTFANNTDVRFSFKFHNKVGEYVSKVLHSQTSKRIKDSLLEDITLGKSISPADYDETGTQYYLSMADIKSWNFNTEEAKTVSLSYFEENPNKQITVNDIIMARSGEGTIGKVALIDSDENEAVYSDFTMRIRLKNYNRVFAYYYFRTDFFQYLIYTHKKGLGNNTNIFPSQVRRLPLPDLSDKEQEKVVSIIKAQIDDQREFERKIEVKKIEINKIIEVALGTAKS